MSARSAAPPRHRHWPHHARPPGPPRQRHLPAQRRFPGRRYHSFGHFPDVFLDDVEDGQRVPARRLGVAGGDCVEELAVEWERAAREIRALERLLPEALESLPHLLEQLREE